MIAFKTLCVTESAVWDVHRMLTSSVYITNPSSIFQLSANWHRITTLPTETATGNLLLIVPKGFQLYCPYFENAFGWRESSCFMNFAWSNSFHSFDFKLKRPTLPPLNSDSHSSRRDPKVSYRGHHHCPRRTQANRWESKLLTLFVCRHFTACYK